MQVSFRAHWLLALALPLALVACGDKEPEQRAAFSQFLQTRIIDKPGVHVPKLTPDESKAFGEYTTHYAVIADCSSDMDAIVKPMGGMIQKASIHSLNDVITRRDDIKAVQSSISEIGVQLKQRQTKADSAHAQLKQPEDLKVVYDKAYDRTITTTTNTLLEVLPQVNKTLESALKAADYATAHKSQIDINGAVVTVKDPKVQAELNALLQDLNAQGQASQQAQAKVQALMYGR